MKRSELVISFFLLPLDALMILTGFVVAYFFRIQFEYSYVWPFSQYLKFVIFFIPLWVLIFAFQGLYRPKPIYRGWEEFASIFISISAGIMILVGWLFLSRMIFFSRLVIIYIWFFTTISVFLGRVLLKYLKEYLYRYGIGLHRLIIIGENPTSLHLIGEVQRNRSLGYKLIGLVKVGMGRDKESSSGAKILGNLKEIREIIKKVGGIDDLVLIEPSLPTRKILELIDLCAECKIAFKNAPNLFEVHTTNIDIENIAGLPLIEFKRTPLDGWGKIVKRTVDLIFSSLLLLLLSPILFIIGLAIKLNSKGPVIYQNERVGPAGIFKTLKFRTMKLEYCIGKEYGGRKAEKFEEKLIAERNVRAGPIYKIKDDPRLTSLGRFLRKTSLDELPQLFNVLKGEMSLIGPRPHQPREVKKYIRTYNKLMVIKPGITGLAQISGRSDLSIAEEVRLDSYYIENWSLGLDFWIILKTPAAVIRKREVE